MSGYCFYNPVFGPDKFGWDLVAEVLELGWTCPAIVSRIQSETRICPVFSENFSLWIDFDVLHFTNSPNAPRLIVRSS
jgi:hypothetical protein